jgi:hypothetical protein
MKKKKETHTLSFANNGWILKVENRLDPPDVIVGVENEDEMSSFIEFLWTIRELCGPMENKYSKERVYVGSLPGCDYEGELSEKQIEDMKDLIGRCWHHLKARGINPTPTE